MVTMSRRMLVMGTLLGLGLIPAGIVVAQNSSSTNFQNLNSSVIPLIIKTNSSNFSVDGSVESIVGSAQSGSFKNETGAQRDPGSLPTPPIPSGGGGGVPTTSLIAGSVLEPPPSIFPIEWTYLRNKTIRGGRGIRDVLIFINGSPRDIDYPNAELWQRDLPLGLGDNEIFVQSKSGSLMSLMVRAIIHRRLIGDVNDNRFVDDVDLSLLTRHWKRFDRQSDFNEDGLIDDVDLSLLASHWGRFY